MTSQNQYMWEEENKIWSKLNVFKKDTPITKHGSSFTKLLSETANISSDTKSWDNPIEPPLQVPLSIPKDTIKDTVYHLDRKIGRFSDQNEQTVSAEIVKKWGGAL